MKLFLNEMSKYPQISNEETVQLIEKGNSISIDKVIKGNWKLVVSAVNRSLGFLSLEHVNTGMIALDHAAKTYNVKSGRKFSTYAFTIIRSKVMRTYNRERTTITLPYTIFEQKKHFEDDSVHLPKKKKQNKKKNNSTIDNNNFSRYRADFENALAMTSIDKPMSDGTSKTDKLWTVLGARHFNSHDMSEQEEAVNKKMILDAIDEFIEKKLNSMEKIVFQHRIYLGEKIKRVAELIDRTPQRVEQCEKAIYGRLVEHIKNYLYA